MRRSLATAIALAVCGCAAPLAAGLAAADADALTVSVAGRSSARPLANNYLGLALTYQGVTRWAGPASRPADPVLVQLIRNLAPHGHPVLRVGGVSADRSWWPINGYRKPIGIWYDLTPKWAASLRGLAQAARARLILGVNLEADRPTLVRVESHELVRRIGRRYIDSLQIGNEPNLYRTVPWYALLNGRPVPQYLNTGTPVYSRPPSWGPADYAAEIARLLPTLPRLPISGPDASGPDNGAASWIGAFARFLHPPGRAVTVTAHAYAAVKCVTNPASPEFPSVPHMLALAASRDQLAGLEGDIAGARGRGDGFRVDEMGTVSCSGLRGVSNSMASALWVLDALFSMDRARRQRGQPARGQWHQRPVHPQAFARALGGHGRPLVLRCADVHPGGARRRAAAARLERHPYRHAGVGDRRPRPCRPRADDQRQPRLVHDVSGSATRRATAASRR